VCRACGIQRFGVGEMPGSLPVVARHGTPVTHGSARSCQQVSSAHRRLQQRRPMRPSRGRPAISTPPSAPATPLMRLRRIAKF
jgi:hypothetical protein